MDKILEVLKNARSHIDIIGSPTDEINITHLAELDGLIKALEKPNPNGDFYYWTLRVGIHKTWVADGVDFTDRKVHDMLTHVFRYATGDVLRGKVLAQPSSKAVATEMGYDSEAEYLNDRRGE